MLFWFDGRVVGFLYQNLWASWVRYGLLGRLGGEVGVLLGFVSVRLISKEVMGLTGMNGFAPGLVRIPSSRGTRCYKY